MASRIVGPRGLRQDDPRAAATGPVLGHPAEPHDPAGHAEFTHILVQASPMRPGGGQGACSGLSHVTFWPLLSHFQVAQAPRCLGLPHVTKGVRAHGGRGWSVSVLITNKSGA